MKSRRSRAMHVLTLFALITVFGAFLPLVKSGPKTWTVDDDGPADFDTIQGAVDAARSFDSIIVSNGNYRESVYVNKNNLLILGQNKDSTILHGSMNLNAWYCTIANLTIDGSGGSEYSGINLNQSSFNIIKNNVVFNWSDGFYFNYMNYSGGHYVLEPMSCHCNTVTENTVTNCSSDLFFWEGMTNNTFYHNNFLGTGWVVDYILQYDEFWDAGYPCGGNYWEDYDGNDSHSGPFQNMPGSDGLGDAPYKIPSPFPEDDSYDHYPLMAPWTELNSTHDVTVLNVKPSKTIIGQGRVNSISVLIENLGDYLERVTPHCTANGTSVTPFLILPVQINSCYYSVIIFTWNTTGWTLGNYSISGTADPVANETHTSDNTLTEEWVTVTIDGDLNGDMQVTLADLVILAKAYGSRSGESEWNPNADMNNNGIIDLGDLVTLAQHYGQHYP